MKEFKGKALYQPQGRSGEYAKWAVNFYNGCTGGCEYCYNKRFPLLSGPKPTLKTCFENEEEAIEIATKEIMTHKNDIIRDGGVFLSFVSDPCLPETIKLTRRLLLNCCWEIPHHTAIPVIILTKQTDWVMNPNTWEWKMFNTIIFNSMNSRDINASIVAFGFTLTGHDELEPGCSSNIDRIRAMKMLHDEGYRTWASIEPVIDFDSSLEMIRLAAPFCDHFKIGLRTDRKFDCTEEELVRFVNGVRIIANQNNSTVYFKRSFRDLVGGGLIIGKNFVEEDFNMFGENKPDYVKIFKG